MVKSRQTLRAERGNVHTHTHTHIYTCICVYIYVYTYKTAHNVLYLSRTSLGLADGRPGTFRSKSGEWGGKGILYGEGGNGGGEKLGKNSFCLATPGTTTARSRRESVQRT